MKKVLFVDFDGTVADSLPALYHTYEAFMQRYGKKGTPDEFQGLNGLLLEEVVEELNKRYTLGRPTKKLLSDYLEDLKKAYEGEIKPMPDALQTLKRLHEKKVRLFLVTSAPQAFAALFFNRVGNGNLFEMMLTAEDTAKGKPAPDLYLNALKRAGVAADAAIAVEDSDNGVASALAAGLTTIKYDPAAKGSKRNGNLAVAPNWKAVEDFYDELSD